MYVPWDFLHSVWRVGEEYQYDYYFWKTHWYLWLSLWEQLILGKILKPWLSAWNQVRSKNVRLVGHRSVCALEMNMEHLKDGWKYKRINQRITGDKIIQDKICNWLSSWSLWLSLNDFSKVYLGSDPKPSMAKGSRCIAFIRALDQALIVPFALNVPHKFINAIRFCHPMGHNVRSLF